MRLRIASAVAGALAGLGLVAIARAAGPSDEQRRCYPEECAALEAAEKKPDPDPHLHFEIDEERPKKAIELEGHIVSSDFTHGAGHGIGGVGIVYHPWIPEDVPTLRPFGIAASTMFGTLGDDRHGLVHFQGGLRPQLGLEIADDVADLFLEPRVLFTASMVREQGGPFAAEMDLGGGIGTRLLGVASAIAWASATRSLGEERFREANDLGEGREWLLRGGLTVSFDLCFVYGLGGNDGDYCRYAKPRTESVDLSPVLAFALDAVRREGATGDEGLCGAVRRAASPAVELGEGCVDGADATCFFRRIVRPELGLAAQYLDRMKKAETVHHNLSMCIRENRAEATRASKNDWIMRERLQYGAYPPEMVRALRCEEDAESPLIDRAAILRACKACPQACLREQWELGVGP